MPVPATVGINTPATWPTNASPHHSDASPKASAPIRITAMIPPSTAPSDSFPTARSAPAARASHARQVKDADPLDPQRTPQPPSAFKLPEFMLPRRAQ